MRISTSLRLLGILTLAYCLIPNTTLAGDVLVAPPLYDLELQPRDIVTKDITLRNETDHKIYVYATVNEIAVDETGEIKDFISPVMDTRETSITSWIEIGRGRIEMLAGEEKTIPFTVKIHPDAPSGQYHAFIGMATESNRPLAEAKTMRGDSDGLILKINLEDKSSDALRMTSFLINRFVFKESDKVITLKLKNEGTKTSVPAGEIIFYNSRGEETASLPVNPNAETIEPNSEKLFELQIPFENKLGRFKANATVRYGIDGKSDIFDTLQFYMVPFNLLIIGIVLIIVFSLCITYLLRRVFYDELHHDDESGDLPLYVRNDREHKQHEHDIHISKN